MRQIWTYVGLLVLTSCGLGGSQGGADLNSVGKVLNSYNFIFIENGSFFMGSRGESRYEGEDHFDELRHYVTLTKDFLMQKTKMTQKQWFDVMGTNPSRIVNQEDCPDEYTVENGTELCPSHPVDFVLREKVNGFLNTINQPNCGDQSTKEGFETARVTSKCYRLPTEAEWEYAARAGTTTPFNLGYQFNANRANFDGQDPYRNGPVGIFRNKTVPVGSLDNANAWGLYDMHGNVAEHVADGVYSNAYEVGGDHVIDPYYHANERLGYRYGLRGGFYRWGAYYCRSASRLFELYDFMQFDSGIRLVQTL